MFHHPSVIDIPTLSELRSKAKLTFLSSVSIAQDPLITELASMLMEGRFTKNQCITKVALKELEAQWLSSIDVP